MSRLTRDLLRHGSRTQRRNPPACARLLCGLEDAEDRRRVLAPRVRFGPELLTSAHGQTIELRLAVVLAHTPFGFDRPRPLQPMERLVQRRILDLEDTPRAVLDPSRNPV